MIIDLNIDQLIALETAFGWGDNSCNEGYIDTETDDCILYGCMCPYRYKLPKGKVLTEGEKGWEIRDSEDYFHYLK